MKSKKAIKHLSRILSTFDSASSNGLHEVAFMLDNEKQLMKLVKALEIGIDSIRVMHTIYKSLSDADNLTQKDYDKLNEMMDIWAIGCDEFDGECL